MSDDTLAGLMERFERYMAMSFKVCLPGVVVQYDHTQQRAQVRVGVRERYRDGRQDPSPVISNVPIIFPRSGGASFTMPVVRGDTVLVLFADRSIETWLDTASGEADSNDWRRHDINDAIAIPGLLPFARGSMSDNNDDVLLTYAGSEVRIQSSGTISMQAGGSSVTMGADGAVTIASAGDLNLNAGGDVVVTGGQFSWN